MRYGENPVLIHAILEGECGVISAESGIAALEFEMSPARRQKIVEGTLAELLHRIHGLEYQVETLRRQIPGNR